MRQVCVCAGFILAGAINNWRRRRYSGDVGSGAGLSLDEAAFPSLLAHKSRERRPPPGVLSGTFVLSSQPATWPLFFCRLANGFSFSHSFVRRLARDHQPASQPSEQPFALFRCSLWSPASRSRRRRRRGQINDGNNHYISRPNDKELLLLLPLPPPQLLLHWRPHCTLYILSVSHCFSFSFFLREPAARQLA